MRKASTSPSKRLPKAEEVWVRLATQPSSGVQQERHHRDRHEPWVWSWCTRASAVRAARAQVSMARVRVTTSAGPGPRAPVRWSATATTGLSRAPHNRPTPQPAAVRPTDPHSAASSTASATNPTSGSRRTVSTSPPQPSDLRPVPGVLHLLRPLLTIGSIRRVNRGGQVRPNTAGPVAGWLALREAGRCGSPGAGARAGAADPPADRRGGSSSTTSAVAPGRWPAGSPSSLNGPQHWVMVDRDAELLAVAADSAPERAADGSPVTIETRRQRHHPPCAGRARSGRRSSRRLRCST